MKIFGNVTTLSNCGGGTFVYTLPRRLAGSFIGQVSFLKFLLGVFLLVPPQKVQSVEDGKILPQK